MACRSSRAALGAVALGASACTLLTEPFSTNDFSGDPYPIAVDLSSGALRIATAEPASPSRDSLLDVLAPISILDPGPSGQVRTRQRSLYVLGQPTTPGGREVARALLSGVIAELHPCREEVCRAGADDATYPVQVVIGSDLLSGDALRLDLSAQRMSLFPDIAGNDSARTQACDALFSAPFFGGGTLLLGGTEVPYIGRRVALSVCAAPAPSQDLPLRERGTDLIMVASTATGISLLGAAGYERYRDLHPEALPTSSLPPGGVTLPSGRIEGRLASIPSLALVGQTTSRGACQDVYAHHYLTERDCPGLPGDGCPCDTGTQCGAPAIVELSAPTQVLIIADEEPLLVALRTELRPDQADVDGILGTAVLARLQVDLDYPNNRVLARCSDAGCQVRPELANTNQRDHVKACLPPTAAAEGSSNR
ncbi:MAG: hypothetical protein R3B48_06095 [Kofleriaceae bacterium]